MPDITAPPRSHQPTVAEETLDVVVGAVAIAVGVAEATRRALVPSFVPEWLRPSRIVLGYLRPLGRYGRAWREQLTPQVQKELDIVVPVVVNRVMSRIDLDEIVASVDIEAVVARVDFQQIVDDVLAKVDLTAIAYQVLDDLDLPELIRQSTGTMGSQAVQSARMRGVDADEAVSRVVGRVLPRRRRPATGGVAPG